MTTLLLLSPAFNRVDRRSSVNSQRCPRFSGGGVDAFIRAALADKAAGKEVTQQEVLLQETIARTSDGTKLKFGPALVYLLTPGNLLSGLTNCLTFEQKSQLALTIEKAILLHILTPDPKDKDSKQLIFKLSDTILRLIRQLYPDDKSLPQSEAGLNGVILVDRETQDKNLLKPGNGLNLERSGPHYFLRERWPRSRR